MEKLRRVVNEIAYARDHSKLPALHCSLIPLLSLASTLYGVALSFRRCLYRFALFESRRLPVAVISVGNLTWGGNGKTPMVEYTARLLADSGVSPLILTRGYACGDEAKMLERHVLGGPIKIGVGANRAATAAWFLEKYGYIHPHGAKTCFSESCLHQAAGTSVSSEEIGAVILDDGMQHWKLQRDLEIVMVNAVCPWGNCHLLPLGPLREPLTALGRADAVVLHHADLVSEKNLKDIKKTICKVKESVPIFYTRMAPRHFFDVRNIGPDVPLESLHKTIVLCVSAIGSAEAFVNGISKIGASYVDRLDFSDHHIFQAKDIEIIRDRLQELEEKFNSRPVVVLTEKDYDRDPEILKRLDPYQVLVLCSELQIITCRETSEDDFKLMLKDKLGAKYPTTN